METKEAFDVNNDDNDIYGELIQSKWFGDQNLTGNLELDKNLIPPYQNEFACYLRYSPYCYLLIIPYFSR